MQNGEKGRLTREGWLGWWGTTESWLHQFCALTSRSLRSSSAEICLPAHLVTCAAATVVPYYLTFLNASLVVSRAPRRSSCP